MSSAKLSGCNAGMALSVARIGGKVDKNKSRLTRVRMPSYINKENVTLSFWPSCQKTVDITIAIHVAMPWKVPPNFRATRWWMTNVNVDLSINQRRLLTLQSLLTDTVIKTFLVVSGRCALHCIPAAKSAISSPTASSLDQLSMHAGHIIYISVMLITLYTDFGHKKLSSSTLSIIYLKQISATYNIITHTILHVK